MSKRSMYARTPGVGDFRVNAPDGFLHDFVPVPWDTSNDVRPGMWWQGSDWDAAIGPGGSYYGPRTPTSGSKLTQPDRGVTAGGTFAHVLPAVTRCTEVIVNPTVATPWVLMHRGDQQPLPRWITDPMGTRSIPGDVWPQSPAGVRLTAFPFWATVLTHALWWGRGAFIFDESSPESGQQPIPGSLRIINPFMINVDYGGVVRFGTDDDDLVVTDHDGRFTVGGVAKRIVLVRGLPPNDAVTPDGVLTRHVDLLRLGANISAYSTNSFASGVPSGFLKVTAPNMTQDQADALKQAWMKAHGGDRRSVAVLNATTDYTPVQLSPVDMDTHEMARTLRIDVAHAFGLSSVVLDTGDASYTYSNLESKNRELVQYTLAPWGLQLMESISSILPNGSHVRVDWPMLTKPDISTQLPALMPAFEAGVLSLQELRQLAGLPPKIDDTIEVQNG